MFCNVDPRFPKFYEAECTSGSNCTNDCRDGKCFDQSYKCFTIVNYDRLEICLGMEVWLEPIEIVV